MCVCVVVVVVVVVVVLFCFCVFCMCGSFVSLQIFLSFFFFVFRISVSFPSLLAQFLHSKGVNFEVDALMGSERQTALTYALRNGNINAARFLHKIDSDFNSAEHRE